MPSGNWARNDDEKAATFANHLQKVFTPNQYGPNQETLEFSGAINQNKMKIKHRLVRHVINNHINVKKSPGIDHINGYLIKELPNLAIKHLTRIFNAMTHKGYFPQAWKISTIIMIPKPGKDAQKVESYRPISILPIFSKVFEKIILIKSAPEIERLIPNHQFGFRAKHGTIEQVHRLIEEIRKVYEGRGYCSALFLDVAQAFDKVWHEGLLYKIKNMLPQVYEIMRSYLLGRKFHVRYNQTLSPEQEIYAGVPQGSVLGPVLYLIYTADLPTARNLMTTTFADDTAILSSHKNRTIASRDLQEHITVVEKWLQKWRIKVNETKCVHVTFTLNKNTCPQIKFNRSAVPQSNEIKYLGVHLDRRLTWKKYIKGVSHQIASRKKRCRNLIFRNYIFSFRS
ncbi:RNA-directed DNA polymerase from mobile element jockey isoform X1 [Toxorhynchites rutilus septentrionalis]|uniref:RNA-directed DNA polymerase from mobile element jockey isoform X1 n=1 Tax=Toxorhynchites rutilus septentrionalis TaxID=329112 RepID=UPI0024787EA8|nr:RNA-directed DNA polymerase from mobile element jockey isoform X1 [Toxorhynchites rutilus septentrionalis]